MIAGFIQSFAAAWEFLILISGGPLGVYAVGAALLGSMGVTQYAKRYLPAMPCSASRDFLIDTIALAAGVLFAWLPMQNVNGMLLGLLAGFASPYFWKGTASLAGLWFRYLRRKLGDKDDAPA